MASAMEAITTGPRRLGDQRMGLSEAKNSDGSYAET